MLECIICELEQSYDEFYPSSKGRLADDGNTYNTQCRSCLVEKSKEVQAEKRAWLTEYKLSRGCADCGYDEHPAALEFDHLPGFEKEFAIKDGVGSAGWARLKAEVEKCEVVCANCHRVRTANRREEVLADA